MSKKALIYDAVHYRGATTYASAAKMADCHDTYVMQCCHEDDKLFLKLKANNKAAKRDRMIDIIAKVDEQRKDGTPWSRMKSKCGYTKTQWQRAVAYIKQTGQTC